jgi:hypothetical protein
MKKEKKNPPPPFLLEAMVYRAKSLPAFNPDGWFLFLGTNVLLFEGSITLLVPLIEAVHTPEDKQAFPFMYRRLILGIVSFYAFFGIVCWMAIGDGVRTVMTTSLPQGMLATMIQLAYSLAVVFTLRWRLCVLRWRRCCKGAAAVVLRRKAVVVDPTRIS